MNQTSHSRIIPALEVTEGAGVTVQRTIGTPTLRNLDPFMLLDHFSSNDPDDYIAGFPSHPHRGFCTFTYMLDGLIEHQDSMGNTGNLGPGSAQWMKAASGIIHSEMPKQVDGLMRGFQLWINLPAAHKMGHPEYQEFAAEAFPVIKRDSCQIKVVIGQFEETQAPIIDEITQVSYLDVSLDAGGQFDHTLTSGQNRFLYLFEGRSEINGQPLPYNSCVVLGDDFSELSLRAGSEGARFVLISGTPINEPVVQYGPFVMNSHEEIDAAMRDYQSNNFVRHRAWVKR